MAEGTSPNTDGRVYSHFLHSSTEDSERHQINQDARRPLNDKNICHFYLQGRCRYGAQCWHSHDLDKTDPKFIALRNNIQAAKFSRRHYEDDEVFYPPSMENSKKDASEPKLKVLNKKSVKVEGKNNNKIPSSDPSNRVDDEQFAPKLISLLARSYADTVKCKTLHETTASDNVKVCTELCPYYSIGLCPYDSDGCSYIHGDECELCQKFCLNPYDEEQRRKHVECCEKELERDMELSFAIQRSLDKTCGICMDVILEKNPISERRFGILEKCNHIFCLSCIRKWRKMKRFESSNQVENAPDAVVTRACPECRVSSDFITPSQYWFETETEKNKLIEDYKLALSKKPCKYFKQGNGKCPFGGACFYLHANPDGTKVELPLPKKKRVRQNQDGQLDFMGRIFLWDYLESREENVIDNFIFALSDSDDDTSEASENFIFSEMLNTNL